MWFNLPYPGAFVLLCIGASLKLPSIMPTCIQDDDALWAQLGAAIQSKEPSFDHRA